MPESSKVLRRISPKIITPNGFESSSVRNTGTTGRTLSSEYTMTQTEIHKAIIRLEREHSELLSLYSKLCDDLLHLRTLEKLDKQREKEVNQIKNKLAANNKEKTEIGNDLKNCEIIFKDFTKKMEKGMLTNEEKKNLIERIQGFYAKSGQNPDFEPEKNIKEFEIADLWDLLPKTEKLIKKLKNK